MAPALETDSCCDGIHCFCSQQDRLRRKGSPFPVLSQELTSDPFPPEDPFKSDPFRGTPNLAQWGC